MMIDHKAKFEEVLQRQGGLYSFADVLDAIESGRFQSFTRGDSWLITQVSTYPRKKVLELVFAMGDLKDMFAMQPEVIEFAKSQGCDMLMAMHSRHGWDHFKTPGWVKVSSNYVREL